MGLRMVGFGLEKTWPAFVLVGLFMWWRLNWNKDDEY